MKIVAFLLMSLWLPYIDRAVAASDAPDNEMLATAITSSNWSWEETTTGTKRFQEIRFYLGGLTGNSQFPWRAHWEILGPRILVLENITPNARYFGQKSYLVFDAKLDHFIGFDFNGRTIVEGFRREAVDPKRQPPATTEE